MGRQIAHQAGLSSGLAQVTLVARTAPQGSIQGVGLTPARRGAGLGESSVDLRLSANTSYKLMVRNTGGSTSRVWVQSAAGSFVELKAGVPVVVAQDSHVAGYQQVQYRIETPEDGKTPELPSVVYDLVIAPTI
jgi:hypothetical protein